MSRKTCLNPHDTEGMLVICQSSKRLLNIDHILLKPPRYRVITEDIFAALEG